jgi:putative DNA methylase
VTVAVVSPKKLIEVALPLDAINAAAAREKSIRHGHPSTLHLWWARRPLAAARAVIFAQLVHDPEDLWRWQNPGVEPNASHKGHWTKRRGTLFKLIEDLVKWENTTNEAVLEKAREEIRKSWRETCELNKHHPRAKDLFDPEKMPGLHDPFAGGGTIPLEAQRLGLEAHASDLNPVAVLINKAMIEIPPKFADRLPVHPDARGNPLAVWKGAAGLAEDVRRYGKWMRDEAFKRIGHLYPPVEVTAAMAKARPDLKPYVGEKLTVIAWLWARTVKSPNPAFAHIDVPLVSSFVLSGKSGNAAYVHPTKANGSYFFSVKVGQPPAEAELGTRAGKAQDFLCVMSKSVIGRESIREEGKAGRLGARLMAIVTEGPAGRVYLDPLPEQAEVAASVTESEIVATAHSTFLSGATPTRAMITGGVCSAYGLKSWGDLFTARQLIALTTLSDLVIEARERIRREAVAAGFRDDDRGLDAGGEGAAAYADAVAVYLGLSTDRLADRNSSLCGWDTAQAARGREATVRNVFARQALPMVWDFVEVNILADTAGSYDSAASAVTRVVERLGASTPGYVSHADARSSAVGYRFVSTDPPYYDNISYADLSEFFYVWLRRSLKPFFPTLFARMDVPRAEELIAAPSRQGTKQKAERFFLDGMTQVMRHVAEQAHPGGPVTIYYAFKQSETGSSEGTSSTGWETFLNAVLRAGLAVCGTWPMRTELGNRMVGSGTNALASSIILVCRPRLASAGTISRRQFVRQLNEALPLALDAMTRESEGQHSPVAPVDLSQAIIGPGMAIFSRYDAVLEADGKPMTVRTALQLINRFLAEGDLDPDTQFCLHWFEQHGWDAAKFGEADTLARAKGTAVNGVHAAGVIESGGGVVRLLRWKEYPANWDPATDTRLPVWEALHQLIRAYNADGDSGAARVMVGVAGKAEAARQLAYRLYTLCERRGLAEDARAYNEVVTGWSGIESEAAKVPGPRQGTLFDTEGAE